MMMKTLLVALALASTARGGAPAVAPPPPGDAAAREEAAPGIPPAVIVDGAEAHALVAAGAVKVVDVRTPEEFAEAHVPGAVNVPPEEIRTRRAELGPTTTPLLVYCKRGHRALLAIATLRELGFTKIYNLQRFAAWGAAEPAKAAAGAAEAQRP
jgi:phage shock protein E